MTTTSTAELEALLATRKAEINGPEPIEADIVTGEIMPVAAVEESPIAPAAPAPVEVRPHYPEIPPKVVGGLPYITEYVRLARTIMETEMVPKVLQNRYDAITACFMRGYELGLGPMQALDSFNVIEGKVGLSAEAMRALILNAGHLFVLSEGEGYAEVTARRSDWPADMTSTYRYSMGDAEEAQLLRIPSSGRKGGWQKNPRDMLAARATSGAARRWFADVLAGMSYTPEEIRDFTPEQENKEAPTFQPTPQETTALVQTPTPPEVASPLTEPPVPSTSPPSMATDSPPEPPKRPRGRPRKDGMPPRQSTAPIGPSPVLDLAPESSTGVSDTPQDQAHVTEAMMSTSSPLNLVPDELAPGEAGVIVQMRHGLKLTLKGLPTAQQPLCRAFIQSHFPGRTQYDLDAEELQKCIDIAAGWPDSMVQHPLPAAVEAAAREFAPEE